MRPPGRERGAVLACALGLVLAAPAALGQEATEASPAEPASAPAEAAGTPPLAPSLGPLSGVEDFGPRGGLGVEPSRLGGFGFPFGTTVPSAPPGPPAGEGRNWRLTPSIGLDLLATDNLFRTNADRRADLVTTITPGVLLTADTLRLRGVLSYVPAFRVHADNSDQNRVDQIGNGQLVAVLVPDLLFLDARGLAQVQSATGGVAPGTSQALSRGNQVQLYTFQISPYLLRRFGSIATAQVGYMLSYSQQEGDNRAALNPGENQGQGTPFFTSQDYIANRGYATIRSGEDLGRLALQATVDGTGYTGTGVYDGAHRFLSLLEARYAVLPTVALLVEGGYENLRFAGLTPLQVSDPVWAVGARLTPGPESLVIARYGRRDGFNSFSLDGSVALGGRTQLFANYREGLSTRIGTAQDLLSTTTLDPLGNPVDSQTGAPVLYANSFFPVQSGLFRTKSGSASLRQSWLRDSITLSVQYQDQTPVSAVPGTRIFPQTSTIGSLSWGHELTPRTTTVATVQYGRTSSSAQPSSDLFSVGGALFHRFTERLTGSLQVTWAQRSSSIAANEYSQAIILAGLRQTF